MTNEEFWRKYHQRHHYTWETVLDSKTSEQIDKQKETNKMTPEQYSEKVKTIQRCLGLLKVDGVYGPKTKKAFGALKYQVSMLYQHTDICMDPSGIGALWLELEDGPEYPNRLKEAWKLGLEDIGEGGTEGNNKGIYIRSIREGLGYPRDVVGPWCAVGISWWLKRAGIPAKSRGAFNLSEKLLMLPGAKETTFEAMIEGQVVLAVWKRKGGAHVRLVQMVRGAFLTLEANNKDDEVARGFSTLPRLGTDLLIVVAY